MKKLLAIIVLGLLWSGNAFAELKGIVEMKLLIDLSDKAKICGVKKEKLETSVRYILSNSKIKIVEGSTPIILYINSNIGENNNICYANTVIRVQKYMKDPGSINPGRFIYYVTGEIASGGKGADFGDPYINSVEQQLKKLVVKHSIYN